MKVWGVIGISFFATLACYAQETTVEYGLYRKVCQQEAVGVPINPPAFQEPFTYFFEPEPANPGALLGSPLMRCYVYVSDYLYKFLLTLMQSWASNNTTISMAIIDQIDQTITVRAILDDLQQVRGFKYVRPAAIFFQEKVMIPIEKWVLEKQKLQYGIDRSEVANESTNYRPTLPVYIVLKMFQNRPSFINGFMKPVADVLNLRVMPRLKRWSDQNISMTQAISFFEAEKAAINLILTDLRDYVKIGDMNSAINFLEQRRQQLERLKTSKKEEIKVSKEVKETQVRGTL